MSQALASQELLQREFAGDSFPRKIPEPGTAGGEAGFMSEPPGLREDLVLSNRALDQSVTDVSAIEDPATETYGNGNLSHKVERKVAPSVWKISRETARPQERFLVLQKWEGTVVSSGNDSFIARLIDLGRKHMHEEAEIPLEEIPEADRELVQPGSVFYWSIGYIDNRSGQRIRASTIRFRRLPVWTKTELDTARKEAKRLRALLGNE